MDTAWIGKAYGLLHNKEAPPKLKWKLPHCHVRMLQSSGSSQLKISNSDNISSINNIPTKQQYSK